MRHIPLRCALLAAVAGLSLAGCDRQNNAAPQPSAATDPTGGDNDERAAAPGALPSHVVDRSHAGEAIPTTALRRPDSRAGNLTSLRGKPMLVNLWATWCAPCVRELPTINRVASEVAGSGHVVTVSQDIQLDTAGVAAWLEERGWGEVASWHDPDSATGSAFGGALPVTLLYDASGKEVSRVIGPMDWYSPEALALLREAGFVIGAQQ